MSLARNSMFSRKRTGVMVMAGTFGLAAVICQAPAMASGFTLSFDPASWNLVNTNPDETLDDTQYECFVVNDVACVENIDSVLGNVDIVGSDSAYIGGGDDNEFRTTSWTITNSGVDSLLSFDWEYFSFDDPNADESSYLVNGVETSLSSADGDFGDVQDILVKTGQTFAFRVTTQDNLGEPGILSITNFHALAIPVFPSLLAPLAFMGVATRVRKRYRPFPTTPHIND